MRSLPLLTLVVLSGLSVGAFAANLTITQKGRVFSSESVTLKKGDTLTGHIGYQKMENQQRSLDIEVRWKAPSMPEESRQVWNLN